MPFLTKTLASLALVGALGALPAAAQQQLGCAAGLYNPTQGVGAQTSITFSNNTQSIRFIYWVDAYGTSQNIGNLMVGQQMNINAAPGTTFEITDGPGNCMEVFRMTNGQYFYDINVISTGAGGD